MLVKTVLIPRDASHQLTFQIRAALRAVVGRLLILNSKSLPGTFDKLVPPI